MSGNCRNNFQPPQCRFGMFHPTNLMSPITSSVGNWIQSTANMFLDPVRYAQNQNSKHFSTNSNHYKPREEYINIRPYKTTFLNIDNVKLPVNFNTSYKKYNKISGISHQMDNIDSIEGHSFDNNFKPGCDKSIDSCNFNYHSGKFHKVNIKDCNKNRRNVYNNHGYKSAEKHKSFFYEGPESYTYGERSAYNRIFNKNKSNKNSNKLKLENKSIISSANNRATEVVAIFTLEDFPELPVPKPHDSWPFKLPVSSQSRNNFTAKLVNNTKTKSSFKNKSNINNEYDKLSKAHDDTTLQELNKDDNFNEDNFVIIMDRDSSKFNKCSSSSTAGYIPFRPRQRQVSECSDDSFIICFTNDAADGVIELTDLLSSDDDTVNAESDQNSDDNESKNEYKQMRVNDGSRVMNKKSSHVKTINPHFETLSEENASQPDSGFDDVKQRKVRFKLEPEIHVMHTWDYAYRAARKGDWENYARDRCRFKNRIDNVNPIISAIFNNEHREKIFNERFLNKNTSM